MSENARHITIFHGFHAVGTADPVSHTQIFDQRFAADQKLIRHHKPGTDDDPPCPDQPCQPFSHLRPYFQIIFQYNGLPVQMKHRKISISLQILNYPIHHPNQTIAVHLKGLIPLPIPMGMGNHIQFQFFHRRSLRTFYFVTG